jgi:predicted homoserine dehydrogenase-like protein
MYRPLHLIGLELGISVASVALRAEPTGSPIGWQADVVATAKRDLRPGETLDGEGGYMVWGKLLPAAEALAKKALPLGLASDVKIVKPVARGQILAWSDVAIDPSDATVRFRRQMEAAFCNKKKA